jgi:hypothetical protein
VRYSRFCLSSLLLPCIQYNINENNQNIYGYKTKDIKIVNIHELLMQQTWTSMKSEVCTLAKIKIKEECQNEKNICKEISQTMKTSQFLDFFLFMTIRSFSIRKIYASQK